MAAMMLRRSLSPREGLVLVLLVILMLVMASLMINTSSWTQQRAITNMTPFEMPEYMEPSLQRKLELPIKEKAPIHIVTFVTEDRMQAARNFIGSLHRHRSLNREARLQLPHVTFYGIAMSGKSQREIALWQNVNFFDVESTILLGIRSAEQPHLDKNAIIKSPILYARAIEAALTSNKETRLLILPVEYNFKTLKLEKLWDLQVKMNTSKIHGDGEVLGQWRNTTVYEVTALSNNDLLGIQTERTDLSSFVGKFDDLYGANDGFCHVALREDVLHNWIDSTGRIDGSASPTSNDPRKLFAIGMPTMSGSSLADWTQIAPLQLFLPSMLRTLTDADKSKYKFAVLIGYDEGDRFFDNAETLKLIKAEMQRRVDAANLGADIEFQFLRFPFTKGWVTFLWNGLFTFAMEKMNADYFFQVNDDLRFDTAGWPSQMGNALDETDGFGAAGPQDVFWRNRGFLLTQAAVARPHYDIFGLLYPSAIKDWYSDDWLSKVYDRKYTTVVTDALVTNAQSQGTRYTACRKPKYEEALRRGQQQIAAYLLRRGKT